MRNIPGKVRFIPMFAFMLFVIGSLFIPSSVFAHGESGWRYVSCYDIVPDFTDAKVDWIALSEGYMHQLFQQNYNDSTNGCITVKPWAARLAGVGAGKAEPQKPPAETGNADYFVSGRLSRKGTGYGLTLSLTTARTKKVVATAAVTIAAFDKKDDATSWGMTIALKLGETAGGKSRKLADVILDYEKKQRESNMKVALGAKLLFDIPESLKEHIKINTEDLKKLSFSLVDCDGYLLKDRKVSLTTSQGKLSADSATSDESGQAFVRFTAPSKSGEATIKLWWDYQYGSDKELPLASDLLVIRYTKVMDSFTMKLGVTATKTELQYDDDGQLTNKSVTNESYTTEFVVKYNDILIPWLMTNPGDFLAAQDANAIPAVLSGPVGDDVVQTVQYKIKSQSWELREGKLVLFGTTEGEGPITDYGVNAKFSPVPPGVSIGSGPATLTRSYRLVISVTGITPNRNPLAPKAKSKTLDGDQEMSYGMSVSNIYPLTIIKFSPELTEGAEFKFASIDDYKGLEDYLTHPAGAKVYDLTARSFSKEYHTTREIKANVKVTLSPILE